MGGMRNGWIYAAQEDGTPLVKIGYAGYVPGRITALKYELRARHTLIASVYVRRLALQVERRIHRLLAPQRIEREWFYLSMSQDALAQLAQQALAELLEEECQKALRIFHAHVQMGWRDPFRHLTLAHLQALRRLVAGRDARADNMAADNMVADAMPADEMVGNAMAGDDMASDDMASDDMTADDMAGDDMTGDDMTADDMTGGKTASDDMTGDDMTGDGKTSGARRTRRRYDWATVEQQIAALEAQGLSLAASARQLGVAPGTVSQHRWTQRHQQKSE
jgi:hypothetical protein